MLFKIVTFVKPSSFPITRLPKSLSSETKPRTTVRSTPLISSITTLLKLQRTENATSFFNIRQSDRCVARRVYVIFISQVVTAIIVTSPRLAVVCSEGTPTHVTLKQQSVQTLKEFWELLSLPFQPSGIVSSTA